MSLARNAGAISTGSGASRTASTTCMNPRVAASGTSSGTAGSATWATRFSSRSVVACSVVRSRPPATSRTRPVRYWSMIRPRVPCTTRYGSTARSAHRVTATVMVVPRAVTRRRQEVSSASIGLARYSSTSHLRARPSAPVSPSRASAVAVACANGLVSAPSTTGTPSEAAAARPGRAGVVGRVALPRPGPADADDLADRAVRNQPADGGSACEPRLWKPTWQARPVAATPRPAPSKLVEGGCGRLLQQDVRARGRGGEGRASAWVWIGRADDRRPGADVVEQLVEPGAGTGTSPTRSASSPVGGRVSQTPASRSGAPARRSRSRFCQVPAAVSVHARPARRRPGSAAGGPRGALARARVRKVLTNRIGRNRVVDPAGNSALSRRRLIAADRQPWTCSLRSLLS